MNASHSEYGPSLPQLIGPRWRAAAGWRKALALLAVALILAAGLAVLRWSRRRSEGA